MCACCRVTWIQLQGIKYVEDSVVVLDTSEILPVFGIIINILLINSREPHFACEQLHTEEFSVHFHCYIINRDRPIPITFCTPTELSDYLTLGLYTLRFFEHTLPTHYVVPQYHLL